MATLYDRLMAIDDEERSLSKEEYAAAEQSILREYERHPLLSAMIADGVSVEGTLAVLSMRNYGILKVLPRRKDPALNARVESLGDLIETPSQLKARGVLFPDNILIAAVESAGLLAGLSYLATKVFGRESLTPEEVVFYGRDVPLLFSATLAPLIGVAANHHRFEELPWEEARYIDEKVRQHYPRR